MSLRVLLPALLLLASTAFAAESGAPLITVLRQEQHTGGTQTFEVTRDARGLLYFANGDGILIHDGAWWTRVDLPSSAFSVAADTKGRVGLTLLDDLGVLARGPAGTLAYQSLLPQVPRELRSGLGQGGLCTSRDGLLFITDRFVARWDGTQLRVVDRSGIPRSHRCHEIDGRDFIATRTGLLELGGPTTFAGKRIDAVLRDLVIVRNEGMFHFDETPYTNDASTWLRGKGVMAAKVLRDGRIAICTLRYGLLLITADGRIDRIIDAAAGLPDVFLFGVEEDDEGSLWLAMDTAIVRVDVAAPLTVLDQRAGLTGTVQTVGRHNGTLYVGTPSGIFAMDTARARRIPSPESNNPWSFLSTHGDLLAGTYGGLLVLHDDAPAELIDGTSDLTIFAMVQSRRDPSRVWLGTEAGLATIRRDGNRWRYEGLVKNTIAYVRSLEERPDGALWYGTATEGVVRMMPDGVMTRFGSGEANVISAAARLVIIAGDSFWQPGRDGALVPDPLLGHIRSNGAGFYAAADARGNVWLSTRPPRVARRQDDGKYEREAHAVGAMEGDAQTFYADPDGVMWIGSERALYRIEPQDRSAAHPLPVPGIRRVIGNGDRVLFDGAVPNADATPPSLPHNFGRVRIEVAPFAYRAKTQYQYRLDPIDTAWTPWTDQAFLDYTNLGANDYTFRVRTRGAAGAVSAEAAWPFTVLAPWYATRWVAALWVILGTLLLAAIVWIRTRTLRLRARRLQSLVDEQTVMLRDANQQLERLSLADPLTGVANRRAFDRAIAEAWKRAVRHDLALAVIMLDLDHFKELNDAHGHTAGDECLRAVAQTLEAAIRENGDDVVARWGGEEFVILLGAADRNSALAVAQRIRAGIEALGITASLGVAVRANDLDPTTLIDRADRALYSAKRAGRNRVHVDEERKSA